MHLAIYDIIDSVIDNIYGVLIIEQETTLDVMKYTWSLISNIFQ